MGTATGTIIQNRGAQWLELPRGVNDREGMEAYADQVVKMARSYRLDIERQAVRNILFYLGLQWIQFDYRLQTWRPRGLKKSTPRPVTNKFAAIINHICSSLQAFKPPVSVNPATQDGDDLAAAMVGDQVVSIIEKESDIRRLKPSIAKWLTLNGSVFLINNYDMSPLSGWSFVQLDRCLECQKEVQPDEVQDQGGVCPHCGATEEDGGAGYEPAVSPKGEPIGIEVPKGKHYTEVKSVLDCYFDYELPSIKMSPHFLVSEMQPKTHLERIYGRDEMKGVEAYDHGDTYSYYVQALAYSTGGATRVLNSGGHRGQPRVRVRRLWIHPYDGAPDGIYAVIAGTKVVEIHPWRYHKKDGEPFLNVNHIKFDDSPGRVLGKSRADDLVQKQEQRNRVESIIELHSRRMANAIWLVAHGTGLSKLSGEQGQVVRYNALAGVPPPQRQSGDPIPPYLIHWMAQIDQEMDDIAGTYEVGRGEAPRGVSAYAALQLLDERARQGQSALFENWSLGFMEWQEQHLDIWREYADEDRYVGSGLGKWAIQKFSGADLQGGLDLSVEIGENKPRTSIGRRANLEQATRLGAINIADPMERFQFLEALGIPELMEDHKIDLQRAHQENDAFVDFEESMLELAADPNAQDIISSGQVPPDAPQPPGMPMPWDNHSIHVVIHRRFFYSDKFNELSEESKLAFVQHMTIHMQLMQEALAAQSAQPSGPGGGSSGTAKGDEAGTDKQQVDKEAQSASPDTGGDQGK